MTIGLVVLQVALKLLKALCNFYIFEMNLIYKSYYEETISLNGKAQDKNLEVVGSSPT